MSETVGSGHGPIEPPPSSARATRITYLPIVIFAGLLAVFGYALSVGDPSKLPSALIGKPVPMFDLPAIPGLARDGAAVPGLATGQLTKGEVSIVNVWASWCLPCREEQPLLADLAARTQAPLYGINYKDGASDAVAFLSTYGNPFQGIGADANGRTSIDWGVYGVPETFIVDGAGRIAFKHVGPITPEIIAEELVPAVERARSRASGTP